MQTHVIQFRVDEDRRNALQQAANAAGMSLSDYCRYKLDLGDAADQVLALHAFEAQRRIIDRDIARKQFKLLAQAVLLLKERDLRECRSDAERVAVEKAHEEIRNDATDYGEEHFADGDALEVAIEQLQAEMAGQEQAS